MSAELCERRNGAEGMELNGEEVGGHRQNEEHPEIKREPQRALR